MKKLVFASVMALASISLVYAPTLFAQDSDQIVIKDPAEFNAYQVATTQSDPAAVASALEGFLQAYPQSVVKKDVLGRLVYTYQTLGKADEALSAATRLLQVDPTNMKALYFSVAMKKSQCLKSGDAQVCDDAAALAQKGLAAPKAADPDGQKLAEGAAPIFHSAIAADDAVAKKDFKAAIAEYRTELMLYPLAVTAAPGPALADTLQLAEAYAKPGESRDLVQAVWFYARAWNFAPAAYKAQIAPKLEYWYKRYHGDLDGLDALKTAAAATLFKPDTFTIAPAPTPTDFAHKAVTENADLSKLNLEDKEFILANGVKEDADKLWAILKGQTTPVPGVVVEASATVIKLAVTHDAKDTKVADFIVNLKKPLDDKDIPVAGTEYKLQPAAELDATYATYTQIPATATTAARAEIELGEGFIQAEKKKPVAPVHKPAAGHHAAH